eukprot:scaffold70909_cov32-Tisochrysis_lutea.AAC.3
MDRQNRWKGVFQTHISGLSLVSDVCIASPPPYSWSVICMIGGSVGAYLAMCLRSRCLYAEVR